MILTKYTSWYPHCTLNNRNYRQTLPVRLLPQRPVLEKLLQSGAARSQPVQQVMMLLSSWTKVWLCQPVLHRHGLPFPTWGSACATLIAATGAALRGIAFPTRSCTGEAGQEDALLYTVQ